MFEKIAIQPIIARTTEKEDADKRALLTALVDTGSLKRALQSVNVSFDTARRWRLEDEGYNAQFDLALRDGTRLNLEAVGIERALHSSDNLLMFFLKALAPETFDEQIRRSRSEHKDVTIKVVDETKKPG